MNPWIVRNLVYSPVQLFRGEKYRQYIKEVRQFHSLSRSQQLERQWIKLKKLLDHVYRNNSYYKDIFDKNDCQPDRIKAPADLKKIPILTKRDIQQHSAGMISRGGYRLSRRSTSGSTGMPLTFVKDRDAAAYMNAVMHEVYAWHGIDIGDRQCRIWGVPLQSKRRLAAYLRDYLLNRRRLVSFDISEKNCRSFFHKMIKFKPKFMYGLPISILEFTRIIQQLGLKPPDMGLKVIIATGETLYPDKKRFLKEAYNCPVVNEYGTGENGIIAFPCAKDNMHIMSHNLYVEVLDSPAGDETKPGETGEVYITELHCYGMPFIRYQVGDMVVPGAGLCECGLQLPMITEVRGRIGDIIVTPEGKRVAMAMLDRALEKYVQKFKVFQRSINRLEVLIEKYPGHSAEHLADIEHIWRPYLGKNMKIEFQIVDRIPADKTGKLRSFVSDLKPNDADQQNN
jgi:phenylacetate-CoA ligase